ncbi:thialysine N-epsilon-acetyltransferase-like, partial [Gigantopelta aegis]|uniref:thialysine N-epsilon-acetyltransferase-like n=1 Tax=Gigantopelta aegis TaxID=1735272 RepID=UPI001B88DCC9
SARDFTEPISKHSFKFLSDLLKDGFGEEKWFHCLVVEPVPAEQTQKKTPRLIGYILWYYTYMWNGRTMYVGDIYVREKWRARGVGSALWKQAGKMGYEMGCRNMVWTCLKDNKSAMCFYEKLGGVNLTTTQGWNTYRMEHPEMKKLIGHS